MARRPAPFKQTDITRAVRAVTAAGVDVGRVEISSDGKIVIERKNDAAPGATNALDAWRSKGQGNARST